MKRGLDFIDQKIISLLQENARMPLKEIAAKVYLSSPAASARIDKLEKAGYITGYHASINLAMMGYHSKAFVTLALEAGCKDECLDYVQQCKNVAACNCIMGDSALLLEVIYPSTEELEQFVSSLQKYGRTQTQVVCAAIVERRGLFTQHVVYPFAAG